MFLLGSFLRATTLQVLEQLTLQVATALLVAGPTLTLWIPGQTASASSYSSLVQTQALFKLCQYNGSF